MITQTRGIGVFFFNFLTEFLLSKFTYCNHTRAHTKRVMFTITDEFIKNNPYTRIRGRVGIELGPVKVL